MNFFHGARFAESAKAGGDFWGGVISGFPGRRMRGTPPQGRRPVLGDPGPGAPAALSNAAPGLASFRSFVVFVFQPLILPRKQQDG